MLKFLDFMNMKVANPTKGSPQAFHSPGLVMWLFLACKEA